MKFYPYSNLKSENLKPLLFSSRLICLLAYLLFAVTIFLIISIPFLGGETITRDMGGATMSFNTPDRSGVAILGSIWSVVGALSLLAFSGLCAAVVSFEYKYTKSDVQAD
ncbi:hypothetical protein CWE13_03115 [Aliidiomarina shirensis]|uniref:Uncharacterized protein n=1 Tax=Aliidiomarina shirensis TaxID=1048642 RepID=A0A432WY47_9GAMM|nr:hypothetical protein [Aliidiomarina shirensis]RUO38651.1 hypothetical protein CWE13_03115 [Aliidiomarina shirensis]